MFLTYGKDWMNEFEENPLWITLHSRPIKQTGELNLSNNIEVNLFDLSSPVFQPLIHLVKILDISGINSITSLEGLPYLPYLHILKANNTQISTFVNFQSIRKATRVSFQNTPISSLPYYQLALLIICGKNLISIDGRTITKNLLQKFSQYPKIASKLINIGWELECPCPDIETLNEIYEELSREQEPRSSDNGNMLAINSSVNSEQSQSEIDIVDFQNVRNEYHDRQKIIFDNAESIFQSSTKLTIQKELAIMIKNLFLEHNEIVDERNVKEILSSIEHLCQKASLKRRISNSLEKC